jgi:signal transduction histidine kinase
MTSPERLAPAELRTLFLFERLTEEQLALLSETGRVEHWPAGSTILVEGEPAECFIVLLSGGIELSRLVHGDQVPLNRTEQRGVYAGATQAFMGERATQLYTASVRAISDVDLFTLPAETFAQIMRDWFPMAVHLLEGLFLGLRNSQLILGERERLLALGSLSAGLTHELNNPAAAAVRATAVLRDRVAGMRSKLALIADGRLDGRRLHELVELQEAAVKQAATAPTMSALETTDAEDSLAEWLDVRDIAGAWDIAGTLVAGGATVAWLDQITSAVGTDNLEAAVRWLAYTVDTELLMREIEDAVTRISTLVAAAKQYSQLDRAPHQTVDVHDLLDATVVMLNPKISPGVEVRTEYDRTLPAVPGYPAELNQVWTNLIDNALDAMHGAGTLTLRTVRDGDRLVVEVEDTGSGIPPDIRPRIFEPFFTTKPVGEGTGLGLDISYRIVVNKHHGDIRVESEPGRTVFRVYLPLATEV